MKPAFNTFRVPNCSAICRGYLLRFFALPGGAFVERRTA